MGASFDFPELDHLTTGAIGPPGQRVFYLQAGAGGQLVSLRLEKTQVAGLIEYLRAMLADLPPTETVPLDLGLRDPVVPEWIVGALGVSFDEDDDRVVLVAEELVREGEEPEEIGVARWRATRAQITAFVNHGDEIVAAGRPPCTLCGLPIDPEGHVCPRSNGHRISS